MKSINAILAILLLVAVGIVVGYSLRTSDTETPGESTSPSFGEAFPARVSMTESDGQQSGRDDIDRTRSNAITRAVAAVSPAVVGINVTEVRQVRDPFSQFFGNDPVFRRFFGDRSFSQEVKGLGSGFIISPDGYIITNDHVAGNATEITITMTNGERLQAKLVGSDAYSDISLLKVDGNNLPFLRLGDSDDIIVGEWAIAFGNPFGLFEINDKPTVTVGVVSSLGMNLGRIDEHMYTDMIETDAAINGGNSGGPLVNSTGEVIGVNTLIFTGGQSATFVGYGFAIPINKVKKIAAELRTSGKVRRDVYAGFDVQAVDIRVARYFGLRRAQGVIITEIDREGPAAKAGMKVGDIIFSVNDKSTNNEDDLILYLYESKPGDTWNLEVYRDREMIKVPIKLGKRSD